MDYIEAHDEAATDYDQQAKDWGWNPEVFFGLMWEYVNPKDSLLDIGIGTGLCSAPFSKAGLKIYGFDGSIEMIRICRDKNIAVDLKKHDIHDIPWPYSDSSINHVIAGGVFHFFEDLKPIFKEVDRILTKGGTFGFLVSRLSPEEIKRSNLEDDTKYAKVYDEASEVEIYKHSESYIILLLDNFGLSIEKELKFLASLNPQTKKEHYGTLFISR